MGHEEDRKDENKIGTPSLGLIAAGLIAELVRRGLEYLDSLGEEEETDVDRRIGG